MIHLIAKSYMELNDYISLMHKKLSGNISPEELDLIDRYIVANRDNALLFEEIRNSYNVLEPEIELPFKLNRETDFKNLKESIETTEKSKTISLSPKFMRWGVAAAILFIAGFFALNPFQSSEGFDYSVAKPTQFSLADNSEVWLNSGARITGDEAFSKTNRSIHLEGEAYFDVHRDEALPFVIHVNGVEITVLGTAFNVKAYKNFVEVKVEEGKVQVKDKDIGGIEILTKDMMTVVDVERHGFSTDLVFDKNSLYWKTGRLTFKDSPINQILQTIEQTFDIRIELLNPELADCKLSGSFGGSQNEIITLFTDQISGDLSESQNTYFIRNGQCK